MKVYVICDDLDNDESYPEYRFDGTKILGVALSEEAARNFIRTYNNFGSIIEDEYTNDKRNSFIRSILEKDECGQYWNHWISYSEFETVE